LIARIYYIRDYREREREWHLTHVYNTNEVLFGILANVNRCRRCFHKFLSNMTLIIGFFCLYFFIFVKYDQWINCIPKRRKKIDAEQKKTKNEKEKENVQT